MAAILPAVTPAISGEEYEEPTEMVELQVGQSNWNPMMYTRYHITYDIWHMIIHISHILYYIYDIIAINSSYVHIYICIYVCTTLYITYTIYSTCTCNTLRCTALVVWLDVPYVDSDFLQKSTCHVITSTPALRSNFISFCLYKVFVDPNWVFWNFTPGSHMLMCFFHPESTNLPDFGVPGARIIRWKSLKSPKIWKKLKSRLSGIRESKK